MTIIKFKFIIVIYKIKNKTKNIYFKNQIWYYINSKIKHRGEKNEIQKS